MNVAYYALGGGHGHAVRGLAVLRRVCEAWPDARRLLLALARHHAFAEAESIELAAPPDEPDAAMLGAWVERTLAAAAPDLLFVDVFPRGILGELGSLTCRSWLVSRWVRPAYYLGPEVRAAIESRYEALAWCEAPAPELDALAVRQIRIPPILIRRPDECEERAAARRDLGVDPAAALILAFAPAEEPRRSSFIALVERLAARSPRRPRVLWIEGRYPAMRWLRAADAIVAAGGYHAVHEARALGVPSVHVPERRLYDDQFRRAAGVRSATTPAQLERAIEDALASPPRAAAEGPDGAAELVRLALSEPLRDGDSASRSRTGTDRSGDTRGGARAP